MKKFELRQIIREEIQRIMKPKQVNELATVLSSKLGGYDNNDFLNLIWKMSVPELEDLLQKTKDDLTWLTDHTSGIMVKYYREDEKWVKTRIEWMKDVLNSKKEDPSFVPKKFQ